MISDAPEQSPSEPRLRLYLLGTPIAQWEGQPVPAWASRRALALLVYVATQHHPIPRSLLVGLFWGDKPEAQGRANLSWVLHAVSSVLPGALTVDRQTVQWTTSPDAWVDLEVFEQKRHQGVTGLAAAAALYRGPFAQGLVLADSPEYEAWLSAERMAWQQRAIDILLALATQQGNSGQLALGLATLDHLLEMEPHQEAAHRLRMNLLVRAGQRDAALEQYEQYRRLLQQNLGVEPESETTALYERIRSAPPVYAFLALAPALPLIGREQESAYILEALVQPECRLLTIVGPGGVGKTRLALACADLLRDRWLHGVIVASLHDLHDAMSLPYFLLEQLGEHPDQADPKEALVAYFHDKELLMVLDSCEAAPDVVDLLSELMSLVPGVSWLVTSQKRLNLRQEWLLDLPGLPFESVEPGSRPAALRLFEANATRVQPHFEMGPAEELQVQQICRMVNGVPLAIELAAMLVRTISCAEIAEEITLDYGVLQTNLKDVPLRQRSLAASWQHTWSLLSDDLRLALGGLSVFQSSFTRQAAAAVADTRLTSLSALIDASMLHRQSNGRYVLLEATRFFTRQHTAATPEYSRSCERHARYYATWMQEWINQHPGVHQIAPVDLELEIPNIQAGQQWAITSGDTDLRQSYDKLLSYAPLNK